VLHETIVFLSVLTEEVPFVDDDERVDVKSLGSGVFQVTIRCGFMEDADVPQILGTIEVEGLTFKPMTTSYFLGRETLIPTKQPGMAIWRERLFSIMTRNARPASTFFRLPPNRVVELGAQIEL
jgi:KUP system potassium uptake protein